LSKGAHVSHLHLFGHEVTPMSKTTFYMVIFVMVVLDIVQSRNKKKLIAMERVLQMS